MSADVGYFSADYGYAANPVKTCVEEVRGPDMSRLTILKNNDRNVKIIIVSELHHTQKVLLQKTEEGLLIEKTLLQNSSISRLYRKIDS